MAASGTEATDADEVVASLETLARLYRSLGRLSSRQRRLIETADTTRLVKVLEAKQVIVDRLKAIQPAVERAVAAWRDSRTPIPPDVEGRVRPLLSEIDDLLKQVLACDAEDADRLACRRTSVAAQLNEQKRAERATRAYRDTSPPGGKQLDLKDTRQ